MNFNNSQNNAREANNVNTRGPQFMNKEGFDPSTLLIGFWNEMISIKMHPALEKSKQTESKVFDYEKVVSTAITLEKATILAEKIEKEILPAIEKGENKNIGIPVGGDSLLVVGTGKKITGAIRPYIAIHKALDEKTKKPEMSIHYEFSRGFSIDDYDAETGDFKKTADIHAELLVFLEILKAARLGLSHVVAHSMRVVNRYFNDKLTTDINEIANKLGVSTTSGGRGYGNKRNNTRDIFGGGADVDATDLTTAGNNASVESLNNINEIDDFLN